MTKLNFLQAHAALPIQPDCKKNLKFFLLLTGLCVMAAPAGWMASLPEDFPFEAQPIEAEGHRYTSLNFGDFTLDPDDPEHIRHDLLGTLSWHYSADKRSLILISDLYGKLHTQIGESGGLGFVWPYLRSERSGILYLVNPSPQNNKPFFSHRRLDNGTFEGWLTCIDSPPLDDVKTCFKFAESSLLRIQDCLQSLRLIRDQLHVLPDTASLEAVKQLHDDALKHFGQLDPAFEDFLFYRTRTARAVSYQEAPDKEQKLALAKVFSSFADNMKSVAEKTMAEAREVMQVEIEGPEGVLSRWNLTQAPDLAATKPLSPP
jgi:hypothetical protein